MKKDKKFGFTLSELLIVLVIIGVITALVLPSLLKDIQAKSRMNTLTSTIDNLQKIIENEITESRAQRLDDTRILSNTNAFLSELNLAPSNNAAFANTYHSITGVVANPPEGTIVLLKNGVGLALRNSDANYIDVDIDVNGDDKPNIYGRDFFRASIRKVNDNQGHHMGDIGGRTVGGDYNNENRLRSLCRSGRPHYCYRLAELSGFNPRYIGD